MKRFSVRSLLQTHLKDNAHVGDLPRVIEFWSQRVHQMERLAVTLWDNEMGGGGVMSTK